MGAMLLSDYLLLAYRKHAGQSNYVEDAFETFDTSANFLCTANLHQEITRSTACCVKLMEFGVYIIPALMSLHWLRVPEHVSFRLAVMTYRSTQGTSPSYLQSCFTLVADITSRRWHRSSTSHRLDVPPVRLSTVGKREFPVSGATVWNDLPLHVTSAPSLAIFRQRLKTFLFSLSYHDTIT